MSINQVTHITRQTSTNARDAIRFPIRTVKKAAHSVRD